MATRLERLRSRRLDPTEKRASLLHEVHATLQASDGVKYAIGAMQPIDPTYTANTYAEAERVVGQLKAWLTVPCTYDYQGSVTNDTHIKAMSDIDVLTLIATFYDLEPPQVVTAPYQGDPVRDLLAMREQEVRIVRTRFPEATVDDSGSKSIAVSGGSLRRKIDLVPSNKYVTVRYARSNDSKYLGVQVLARDTRSRILNLPFLHNAEIQAKDQRTHGGLRKAIRLMKSIKYDRDLEDISSYDICGIAYNMADHTLIAPRPNELALVSACFEFCQAITANPSVRQSMLVPNGTRAVFGPGGATLAGLTTLTREIGALVSDIVNENRRSFTKLAEARVQY